MTTWLLRLDTPPGPGPTVAVKDLIDVAVNLAGHRAIVVPVPRPGPFPAAVQLIGRRGAEEELVATAAVVEAAVAR